MLVALEQQTVGVPLITADAALDAYELNLINVA